MIACKVLIRIISKIFVLFALCQGQAQTNTGRMLADGTLSDSIADYYYAMAENYQLSAENDTALIFLNQALEVRDTANYQKLTGIYLLKSTVYGSLALFDASMENALNALSVSEQHQLTGSKARALLSIGHIHYMMYNDEKAEEFMCQPILTKYICV